MNFPITGLIAAPFTPFQANGDVQVDTIPRQAALLARNGVAGAFVCGTTGEGASLTSEERRRVAEAWVRARPPGLKIFVHVGHLSQREASALAQHAQAIGADAVATLAPSFFKPANVRELVNWCAPVAAAAPKLPFFYYHIPSMTGVTLPVADFLREAEGRIPTLAGIKFTYEDLADYQASRAVANGRPILFGRDEMLLSALELGATGAVGSTYNYSAPIYHRVIAAHQAGDHETAKREQAKARAAIDVMARAGGLAAGKAIMKLIGLDCGPVRSPLRTLTADDERALRTALEGVGFFEFANK